MSITGSVNFGDGQALVTVDHDPTVDPTDLPKGSLIINAAGTIFSKRTDGDNTDVLCVSTIETSEIVPQPESAINGANNTRADQAVLNGASFKLDRGCAMNRILFRVNSDSGAPTLAIGIYQAPGGGSGIATKRASVVAFPTGGSGLKEAAFAEGNVNFDPGLIYILFGRDSAIDSFSLSTYGRSAQTNLLVDDVPAGVHPTEFLTALPANALPASFDPVGDAAVPGAANTALQCRLRKV